MKKIILLIILLFSTAALAQSVGWTSLMETNITVGDNNYDIFTNRYGNHIIVQETSSLKYYRMDVEGNTELSTDLETSAVVSPSISGDAARIFVVYGKSTENKIITKYSNDGGTNWSYISYLNLSGTPSSIECVFSKGKLHVTYQVGTTIYFSYYNINVIPPGWISPLTVSDPIYIASNPRIGLNSGTVDTVYFTWNRTNQLKWRSNVVGGTMLPILGILSGGSPTNLGFVVDDLYLYVFFNLGVPPTFQWTVRRIFDNHYEGTGNSNSNNDVNQIFTTRTANNKPYTSAWDKTNDPYPGPYRISRMGFNGTEFLEYDLIYQDPNLTPVNIVNLSAAENDVHAIWKDNLGTNNRNNLRYKYYDDIPLVPQNLAVVAYMVGDVSHPKLTWSLNNAPDVYINENAYEIQRRIRKLPGS
ncbi:MAG: hypothetical protein WBQ32_12945 [Ignavibacteriaceae bacterium]